MSNVTNGWLHKDEWKREGKEFCVVVSRHTANTPDEDKHRWCVYLYVYKRHPAFALFKPDRGMFDQPHFNCHSYVSLFRVHRNDKGEIGSFQLGWDYNHDGDNFGWRETPDDAAPVFWDAQQLFDQAQEWADQGAAEVIA